MKLNDTKKKIIKDFIESLSFDEGFNIWNDKYIDFEQMIMQIPACKSLSQIDIKNIFSAIFVKMLVKNNTSDDVNKIVHPSKEQMVVELVDSITEFIESLPRAYTLKISLPSFPNWGPFALNISPDINIVSTFSETPNSEINLNMLAKRLQLSSEHDAPEKGVFIEIGLRGYADKNIDSPETANGIALLKICSFILIHESVMTSDWMTDFKSESYIYDIATNSNLYIIFSETFAKHIGKIKPNEDHLKVVDYLKNMTRLTSSSRLATSNIEKIEAFERMLVPISRILKHRKLSVFRPIQAAIEWYQDSLFINDQTIAYLSACIGLEAIFGESDMNEMSRRVEDRYAFLLGKNSEDRKKLAEEYREILKIRGKIVHAREKKLNNYQSSSLYKVQEMLRKSIMHELSVLD